MQSKRPLGRQVFVQVFTGQADRIGEGERGVCQV